LDHFGAHLGRQLGGERLRDQRPGRDDLDALQRPEFLANQIVDAHRFGDDAGFYPARAIQKRRSRLIASTP
jgi:hypothetical protein